MTLRLTVARTWWTLLLVSLAATVRAQTPVPPASAPAVPPAAPAAPAAPPSPVSGIRNKIAAGDLLSAESILEVHRDKNGEDGPWLVGLSWLARGALLTGDFDKAKRYASETRARCADSLAHGADLATDHTLETALGAAIEVQAQLTARTRGAAAAADYVRSERAAIPGPIALRSRLNKRIDLLTLTGRPAPEIEVEDALGDVRPSLASLRGKPVLLFLWAEWCSDCKSQAALLARTKARWAAQGLEVVAVTRYYDDATERAREKARVDSVWTADYAGLAVPRVFSTASMERYGVSSTPTYVFIDRAGVVRRYTPTRLTQAEVDRTVAATLK
jgi:thiol-disulfide isomerase/thioredoxin